MNDERCVTVTMDDARERGREGIENARGAFASRLASVKRAGGGGVEMMGARRFIIRASNGF